MMRTRVYTTLRASLPLALSVAMIVSLSSCAPLPRESPVTPPISPSATKSAGPPIAVPKYPPVTEATVTPIACVPDTYIGYDDVKRRISGFSGLAIVGVQNAFVVKADNAAAVQPGWATFSHISGFNTPSETTQNYTVRLQGSAAPYPLGHANGLAYYRTPGTDSTEVGSFYIPMMKAKGEPQVAQTNIRGEITKLFKARYGRSDKRIASITYRGNGTWIVATAGESTRDRDDPDRVLRTFYTARIVGDYFELDSRFFVPTTTTFNVGQDIAYEAATDELLIPVWDGLNNVGTDTRRRNRIIVVSLGVIEDQKVYRPSRWIDYTPSDPRVTLYEFEGIDFDIDGRLFVGSNIIRTDGGSCMDAIDHISEE